MHRRRTRNRCDLDSHLVTVGLIVVGTSCGSRPEYRTDATIKDIMDSAVDPNADFLWDSVSSESSVEKGLVEKAPKTKEEWKEVRRHTVALMAAGPWAGCGASRRQSR